MEDIIDIIVTETTNIIEITSQPTDEIIDVNIIDNREEVTINVTPTLVEVNINTLTGSFGVNWGDILGTISNQTDLQAELDAKADLVGGTVPTSQLPIYVHTQSSPSTTWTITHNLNKYPSVTIIDSANDEVIGEVRFTSINQVVLTFSAAFSGKAFLN